MQRAALEQLHRDVGDALVLADVEDGDDARVVEPAGRAGLAQEALAHLAEDVLGQIGQQRLERHLALDQRVDRAVHDAHRAASELAHDPVTAERLLHVQSSPLAKEFYTAGPAAPVKASRPCETVSSFSVRTKQMLRPRPSAISFFLFATEAII